VILAIDFGTRRCGFARSDPARSFAVTLAPLVGPRDGFLFSSRGAHPLLTERLRRLIADESPELLVIGNPRHADGSESDTSRRVRRFGDWVARTFKLPVAYWDEHGSTRDAAAELADAGWSPGARLRRSAAGIEDSVAARLILQSYLDAHPAAPTEGEA